MRRSKKTQIEFICTKCGDKPEPSKTKSNNNWNVYDTTCKKCGGKVTFEVIEGDERW